MRPPFYIRQLKRDLDRWIADGLVPMANRERILASVAGPGERAALPAILGVLGVVLLAAAAMSFVAANWEAMPKLARLGVVAGGMWTGFVIGAVLLVRQRPIFAHAAILFGIAMFGAGIFFVGQLYHLNSGWPPGLMLWAAGALATAALVPSRPAFIAALAIGFAWIFAWIDARYGAEIHWSFLAFLAGAAALAHWRRWHGEFHLYAVAFFVWALAQGEAVAALTGFGAPQVVAIYTTAFLVLFLVARFLGAAGYVHAQSLERYMGLAAFIGFFVLLRTGADEPTAAGVALTAAWLGYAGGAAFLAILLAGLAAARGAFSALDLLAAIAMAAAVLTYPVLEPGLGRDALETPYLVGLGALIVWAVAYGARVGDRVAVNGAFTGFGLWTLYLYTEVFADLLDQAAFFAVGGAGLVALAVTLDRVRRRVLAREQEN